MPSKVENVSTLNQDKVEVFEYWSFNRLGGVQMFTVTHGEVTEYREYADRNDAPLFIVNERTWNPGFVGPIVPISYYGRAYDRPV